MLVGTPEWGEYTEELVAVVMGPIGLTLGVPEDNIETAADPLTPTDLKSAVMIPVGGGRRFTIGAMFEEIAFAIVVSCLWVSCCVALRGAGRDVAALRCPLAVAAFDGGAEVEAGAIHFAYSCLQA